MSDELGKIGVIVAARTGSSRLPGKVVRPLDGVPMILFLLARIAATRHDVTLVMATTDLASDDELAKLVQAAGFQVFRGAGNDVVERYVDAAQAYNFDVVVRVTGDCPFVDSETLDYCLDQAKRLAPFDLATTKGRFPVGIDYEIYPAALMATLHNSGLLDAAEREHLTLYLYRQNTFRVAQLEPLQRWQSPATYTVDTLADFERAERLIQILGCHDFSIADLVAVRESC